MWGTQVEKLKPHVFHQSNLCQKNSECFGTMTGGFLNSQRIFLILLVGMTVGIMTLYIVSNWHPAPIPNIPVGTQTQCPPTQHVTPEVRPEVKPTRPDVEPVQPGPQISQMEFLPDKFLKTSHAWCQSVYEDDRRRCELFNVCYHKGKWLYFNTERFPDKLGLCHTSTGTTTLSKTLSVNFIDKTIPFYALSQNATIEWTHKPTTLQLRVAGGNPGHCFVDGVHAAFNLLKHFGEMTYDNQILQQDMFDCDCAKELIVCGIAIGEDQPKCKHFSKKYYGYISINRYKILGEMQDPNKMYCFSKLMAGSQAFGTHYGQLYYSDIKMWRDFMLNHPQNKKYIKDYMDYLKPGANLTIRYNPKDGKRSFYNMREAADWIREDIKEFMGFKVVVEVFDFSRTVEQMQQSDVLITAMGGGAYDSVFLPDGAAMVCTPFYHGGAFAHGDGLLLFQHMSYITFDYYMPNTSLELIEDAPHANSALFGSTQSVVVKDRPKFMNLIRSALTKRVMYLKTKKFNQK
jgi:hypothetical protein